jgi:hypothetical protein
VNFEDSSALDTRATFSVAGIYQIQCAATLNGMTGSAIRTVAVDTPVELTFRQGVGAYSQETTTVRADNPTWNAGARDQFLVGRVSTGTSALRGLLSFDLGNVPTDSIVSAASLDLTTHSSAGNGTVGEIELRTLTTDFTEGSGSGLSATPADPNTSSGANWQRRSDATANLAWNTSGGSLGTTVLSRLPGFNAATALNTPKSFATDPAFVAAVQAALGTGRLNLSVVSPLTEAPAAGAFARFHSDDALTESQRPQLRLEVLRNLLPDLATGPAPAAVAGSPAALTGSATGATTTGWSLVSGPGTASFASPNNPATAVTFSQPGSYTLRLLSSNAHGSVSRTLEVTAAPSNNPAIFTDWQQLTWPGETNPSIIGSTADPDHDGLNNLLEWGLHLDPKTPDLFSPVLELSGAVLDFTYTRRKTSPGEATFTVEWSDTLAAPWTPAVSDQPVSLDATRESVHTAIPAGPNGRRFVRVRIIR